MQVVEAKSMRVRLVSPNYLEYFFSYQRDTDLLMLHSNEHSMQWPAGNVGIILSKHEELMKVGIQSTVDPFSYQSFAFTVLCYEECYRFFRSLGFPLHGADEPAFYDAE